MIAFYSIRLLVIMKRGALEKSWRYVFIGSFMLVLGILAFSGVALMPRAQMPSFLFNLGGISMLVGGFFLILGLRVQYGLFHMRLSFERINEQTRDLA
jgi:hypothetical protein